MGAPDEELMLRAGRGDLKAFEELVARYEADLINYFFRLHHDRQRAEDEAQEVFLKLFTHARSYEPTAKFTTYLYRIAHNHWVDELRRMKAERGYVSLDAGGEEGQDLHEKLSCGLYDPREELRREELAEAVTKAVGSLPEGLREVLVLAGLRSMRYAEIAEVLGIPEGTVKSRMHMAVKRLRERLASVVSTRRRTGC